MNLGLHSKHSPAYTPLSNIPASLQCRYIGVPYLWHKHDFTLHKDVWPLSVLVPLLLQNSHTCWEASVPSCSQSFYPILNSTSIERNQTDLLTVMRDFHSILSSLEHFYRSTPDIKCPNLCFLKHKHIIYWVRSGLHPQFGALTSTLWQWSFVSSLLLVNCPCWQLIFLSEGEYHCSF